MTTKTPLPRNVPIPKRMAHLDRDARGYPIPVMVWRDPNDNMRPHFTINDEGVRFLLAMDEKCSICGQKLLPVRWFVGGPLSAFHEHGSYHDPALHRDCMHYAMRVCPWLAMPSYAKRIDTRTVRSKPETRRLYLDHSQDHDHPQVFVCVATTGQTISSNGSALVQPIYIRPTRPYVAVEFWRGGHLLRPSVARDLLPVEYHHQVA